MNSTPWLVLGPEGPVSRSTPYLSIAECAPRWLSLRLDTSHAAHSALTGGVVRKPHTGQHSPHGAQSEFRDAQTASGMACCRVRMRPL